MVPLNPGEQRSYIATISLLLAAAFIVAVHSDCGVPPRFHFAVLKEEYRNETRFAVGSSVEYDCRSGYIKKYKSILRCTSFSKWLDKGEFCKARSCLHPGEPENGRLVILTDLTFGATVKFTCEEGYRLIGDAERKCVLEGSQVTWDREIPYCQVIPCRPPPETEHGTHTGTTMEEFNYGTSVTYQCDTVKRGQVPFSLIGEPSIHCTSTDNVNGDWSGPAPECKVIRCEQPNIDHGKQMTGYSPVYTYRASVLFECEHRFTLKGSSVLQCNENSRWDPQLPVCERSSCDDPPFIRNTYRDHSPSNLFPAGTVVNYNCKTGYELIPGISSASVTCQKDFTWSEHQEFCQRIRCPYPHITNGKANPEKEKYVYEDKINIKCDPGNALRNTFRNNYRFKCEYNGAWSPALPICEPACGPPPYNDGQHNHSREKVFLVGSRVTYRCDRGLSLVGVSSIQCIAGDRGIPHWNAPAPECKACEPPAPISHGQDNRGWGDVFLLDSRVTYRCDQGWSLVGVSSIRCIAGDRGIPHWDAPAPECKACEPPAPISHGQDNRGWGDVFLLDSRVTYRCDQGWSLVGVSSIRCIAGDGGIPRWDAPAPECRVCEPPAPISHGQDNRSWGDVFLLDSRVTYRCDQGWSLVGVSSIRCIAGDGGIPRWDAPAPECKVTPHCLKPMIENVKQISLNKTVYIFGDHVEFQCESNYILKGSKWIECEENGTWNPPVPSCIKVGCPKPDVQNGGRVNALHEKMWYNTNESITFQCSPGYQFSDYWYLSATGSLNITCSADGTWTVLPKCEKQIQSPLCNVVRESVKFLRCDVSLMELKTLLEAQKLYLEIQKLKRDLQKYNE